MNPIILIPAYNPDEMLLSAIEGMKKSGFDRFVLVDDGSRPDCRPVFEAALALGGCELVRHAINLGKGRALKTGFNYILDRYPDASGAISVDADGQHPPKAVRSVAQAMARHPGALVLGVRQFFKGKNVPLPNLMGNTITRAVFWLLTGLSFGDTQCGLRGYPRNVMKAFLPVQGDRFEYENVMLLHVRSARIDVAEVAMDAVYIGENTSSHFNRVADSIRIYSHLIGYAAVPLTMALVSLLLFREIRMPAPGWWAGTEALWAAAACALSTLAGWAIMLMWLPGAKLWAGLGSGIASAAVHGTLFALLHALAGWGSTGSWWLAGLPAAVLSYRLWLYIRYGKKPRRYTQE
ncbi:MAG: glycosyltransferase family 2 protein [Christensenellales bacterium]|jgi:glycosyltransferase involved in cell wall biosynthesis